MCLAAISILDQRVNVELPLYQYLHPLIRRFVVKMKDCIYQREADRVEDVHGVDCGLGKK